MAGESDNEVHLDVLSDVLLEPRAALLTVASDTGWQPTEDSAAAVDFSAGEFPDDLNAWLLGQPRVVASLYLRSGADHLAGLSAVLRARECWSAPGALARAALEHGARARWVLTSRIDVRQRTARAMLEELASVHFSMLSISGLGGRGTDQYSKLRERRRVLRDATSRAFDPVSLTDDPFKWTIESETYPRITEVAADWGAGRDDPIAGRGIYDYLSLYPHPQSLAGRVDVEFNTDKTSTIKTTVPLIARMASAALAAWFGGFVLLTTYHGFEHVAVDRLESEAKRIDEIAAL
jgi:hypothetical protein